MLTLLVAQGLDGVECGCTIGGVKAESDPDGGTDDQAGDGPAVGENHIYFEPKRDEADDERANADHASNIEESAFERIVCVDLEIIILICLKAAGNAHRADPFVQGSVVELR